MSGVKADPVHDTAASYRIDEFGTMPQRFRSFRMDIVHAKIDHAGPTPLPSRRQRLLMLMRLKTQRRVLLVSLVAALLACAIFASLALRGDPRSEAVGLGTGIASIEALPVRAFVQAPTPRPSRPSPEESGIAGGDASFYGNELAGDRTASGERFDPERLTAAHRTLPLGSRVRVTNARTGDSVIVRINDRGPFHGNRVIDLSLGAARQIGLIRSGTARVDLALLV